MDSSIPKTSCNRILHDLKITPQIRNLQKEYLTLKTVAQIQGWTYNNHRRYIQIRQEIREACKEEFSKNWENQIKEIMKSCKDTKTFWKNINKLRGTGMKHNNYLEDGEGNKYHTDKEKCDLMKTTWENIFKITPEEDINFDRGNTAQVNDFLQRQHQRITPSPTANIDTLNNNIFSIRPITTQEVKNNIRRTRNKAPGQSKINKTVIEQCPDHVIDMLTNMQHYQPGTSRTSSKEQ